MIAPITEPAVGYGVAGGIGIRYFIARGHGLHMGLDVARGPDQTVIYVVLGNAWLRP